MNNTENQKIKQVEDDAVFDSAHVQGAFDGGECFLEGAGGEVTTCESSCHGSLHLHESLLLHGSRCRDGG